MAEILNDYPNLSALAQGCVSGRVSEWPGLKPEAAAILAENARLREALLGVRERDASSGPCWCIDEPGLNHDSYCVTASDALTTPKDSGNG